MLDRFWCLSHCVKPPNHNWYYLIIFGTIIFWSKEKQNWLVASNMCYFPEYIGIILPIDFHIFQRAWYTINQKESGSNWSYKIWVSNPSDVPGNGPRPTIRPWRLRCPKNMRIISACPQKLGATGANLEKMCQKRDKDRLETWRKHTFLGATRWF